MTCLCEWITSLRFQPGLQFLLQVQLQVRTSLGLSIVSLLMVWAVLLATYRFRGRQATI